MVSRVQRGTQHERAMTHRSCMRRAATVPRGCPLGKVALGFYEFKQVSVESVFVRVGQSMRCAGVNI